MDAWEAFALGMGTSSTIWLFVLTFLVPKK